MEEKNLNGVEITEIHLEPGNNYEIDKYGVKVMLSEEEALIYSKEWLKREILGLNQSKISNKRRIEQGRYSLEEILQKYSNKIHWAIELEYFNDAILIIETMKWLSDNVNKNVSNNTNDQ